MYISRIQIRNFRNFRHLDVAVRPAVVVVGENGVGKSNLVHALRLVLDANLPDASRQLKFADIWDGVDITCSPEVRVDIDFSDFDGDPGIVALLTDYRLASDHTIARLSYVFRKRADVVGAPASEADYDFKFFGGDEESRPVRPEVRRRICIDVLHALRDAERDLAAWRTSPLRPMLEDAIRRVAQDDLRAIAVEISAATDRLVRLEPVRKINEKVREDLASFAGSAQDMRSALRFTPADPLRLFRSIALFIDDGKRNISDASIGSANLILITLKLAEFAWRRAKNERNYTLACIEEPEAHLHPHLQRSVFSKLLGETEGEQRGICVTTHSPIVAGVAQFSSLIVLRYTPQQGTKGFSLANLQLDQGSAEDLQRYLDNTRAEVFFSRGVLLVEGDAEAALMPVFALSCGYDLDDLGITVCNVAGTNFSPYVKLVTALGLPYALVTDWDPLGGTELPLGQKRCLNLIDEIRRARGASLLTKAAREAYLGDEASLRGAAREVGIFVNEDTLEVEIARSPELVGPLVSVLEAQGFGAKRQARLSRWKERPDDVDGEQLLAMVADVGKGRLAGRLAEKAAGLKPPGYIAEAIKYLSNLCSTAAL